MASEKSKIPEKFYIKYFINCLNQIINNCDREGSIKLLEEIMQLCQKRHRGPTHSKCEHCPFSKGPGTDYSSASSKCLAYNIFYKNSDMQTDLPFRLAIDEPVKCLKKIDDISETTYSTIILRLIKFKTRLEMKLKG